MSSPWYYERIIGPWVRAGHHVLAPLHVDSREHPDNAKFPGLASWKARDPLVLLRDRMRRSGVDDETVAAIDARVEVLMDEAVDFATTSPDPSVAEFLAEVAAS